MTAQHPKLFDDERGHGVITDERKRTIATANNPQDARRLVACWNACAGIDTDTLEELGPDTSLSKIAVRAIDQRAELLVALQNLVGLARMGAAPLKDYKAALAVADAAIQKATNKEQP